MNKKTKTEKKQGGDGGGGGDKSYSKRVRAKLYCCAFKLGFLQLQLICKASLTLKSILDLALLVTF